MKTWIWIVASLIVHFSLALSFVLTRSHPAMTADQIIDLTVVPFTPLAGQAHAPSSGPAASTIKSSGKMKPATLEKPVSPKKVPPASGTSGNDPSSLTPQSAGPSGTNDQDLNPVAWGQVTTFPKIIKEVKAPYPESAKAARIEGVVEVDLIVSKEGKVLEAVLIKGPGYGLNESALEALRKFEFLAALIENQKVTVKIRYKYKFKLGTDQHPSP